MENAFGEKENKFSSWAGSTNRAQSVRSTQPAPASLYVSCYVGPSACVTQRLATAPLAQAHLSGGGKSPNRAGRALPRAHVSSLP
jgi:hypothetical protein